jgi:Protein DA1
MHDGRKRFFVFVLIVFIQSAAGLRADVGHCAVCGGDFGDKIYTLTDKVTREKIQVCYTCATWPKDCFICGLPARKDFVELRDGRFICARDAKTAVLDENEAKEMCRQIRDALDRTFSRFMTFPDTNVNVAVLDRVDLLAFKVPGNDFECPNLLGYFRPETNEDQIQFEIRVMSALPRAEFKSTCAHELSHAWVFENVPAARRKTLRRDAHEGFCELMSYLLMDAQQEEAEKKAIRQNNYTRGQIELFIEAERRYGLDEILDWMKYGVDAKLDPEHLDRVRDVVLPRPALSISTGTTVYARELPPAPDTLVLRGISTGKNGALAVINDQTLAVDESGRVRVGKTNVMVRCLAIEKETVRIRIEGTGVEQELRLASPR